MATVALEALRSMRAEDEEIVAIVENDACGVDALQYVTVQFPARQGVLSLRAPAAA